MSRNHSLAGLALSAIRCTPQHPALLVGNGVARVPELRCYAGIRWSSDHLANASVLYPVAFFGIELEVVPLLVNAPAIICNHKVSIASILNHLIIVPRARFETDVRHSDYWELVVFGPHASVAPGLTYSRSGFAGHEISYEFSTLDCVFSLCLDSFVIVAEGPKPVSMVEGCIHYYVHVFGSVLEFSELIWLEKAPACEVRLVPQNPVELYWMPTGLVHLQRNLIPTQDNVRFSLVDRGCAGEC